MATPLVTELKSITPLQTYLNVAIRKLLESDKYQILKVTNQESSRIDCEDDENFDRFTLVYTILDTTLKFTFLFDNNNINAPPDIILEDNIGFDKECEKFNILNYSSIVSQWNVKDENCLINIMNNIKNTFRDYELNKAIELNVERFNFEINTLVGVCENYTIMMVPHDVAKYEKVRIVVPVEKKSNNDNMISFDDANDYVYGVLLVIDFVVDKTISEVVSSSMDYIFSNKTKNVKRINKKMPKWDINTFLHDYLRDTETTLDNLILLKTNDNIRKEFMAALISEFNEYLLEYDSLDYSYASFFVRYPNSADNQANSIVLIIYLTDDFPHHEPIITVVYPYHQMSPEQKTRFDIKYHFSKKFFTETPKRYKEAASTFKHHIIKNIPKLLHEY